MYAYSERRLLPTYYQACIIIDTHSDGWLSNEKGKVSNLAFCIIELSIFLFEYCFADRCV